VQTSRRQTGQIQTKLLYPPSHWDTRRFSPGASRIANPNIIHPAGKPPNDLEDRRQHVEMLVAIKMGKSQSGLLKTHDLRCDLTLDLIPVDASENGVSEKFTTGAGKASRFINQGRQDFAPQNGSLFHERKMQANIQFRVLPSQRDSLLESTPRYKERGTCHDSFSKRPQDPSVNSRRQSQVIRVNDQLFQGLETRAARISCRIFIRNATSS